ncbi:P-type conjugative transfer protein TrbL [Caulobacter hibisci]|uniref:P-type conjugative transfer protein TrbL n=1 Tax=Caulobacter hibisci TaxID=2035993 RepID=A0ABS0SZX6_9CAUL|nr:P-type conjugative transfer protein TrbL [Caulobacter hibisci]MBI1685159.1 P-type conjugative transfer protein TrbL [Caulobacter hibisci]
MEGTGVIDRFLGVFTAYIDSGFGLLGGEVAFIATSLIVIDVTLAALFWSLGEGEDVIARLIRKTLFVGAFAYLIGNWNTLARIIFESFAGLGVKATGASFSIDDLMRPGRVAQAGIDAGRPLLESISGLMGYVAFFENFIQIAVLLIAWLIVILSFFVLSVQLFVTLIEFKLTTLCGFVLAPWGLFGKTAFLAERVLGSVVASGVKVMVLAVVTGIGSTLFSQFTTGFAAGQPTIEEALAVVLASLCLLGLGLFAPGIASGLISGGPQLSAGAAVGTAAAAGGVMAAGAAAAGMAVGGAAGLAAGAARGAAGLAGAATGAAQSGGAVGVAKAAASGATSPLRRMAQGLGQRFEAARKAHAGGGQSGGDAAPPSQGAPDWARRMRQGQTVAHGASTAAHAASSSQSGGGAAVDLSEES